MATMQSTPTDPAAAPTRPQCAPPPARATSQELRPSSIAHRTADPAPASTPPGRCRSARWCRCSPSPGARWMSRSRSRMAVSFPQGHGQLVAGAHVRASSTPCCRAAATTARGSAQPCCVSTTSMRRSSSSRYRRAVKRVLRSTASSADNDPGSSASRSMSPPRRLSSTRGPNKRTRLAEPQRQRQRRVLGLPCPPGARGGRLRATVTAAGAAGLRLLAAGFVSRLPAACGTACRASTQYGRKRLRRSDPAPWFHRACEGVRQWMRLLSKA